MKRMLEKLAHKGKMRFLSFPGIENGSTIKDRDGKKIRIDQIDHSPLDNAIRTIGKQ